MSFLPPTNKLYFSCGCNRITRWDLCDLHESKTLSQGIERLEMQVQSNIVKTVDEHQYYCKLPFSFRKEPTTPPDETPLEKEIREKYTHINMVDILIWMGQGR